MEVRIGALMRRLGGFQRQRLAFAETTRQDVVAMLRAIGESRLHVPGGMPWLDFLKRALR